MSARVSPQSNSQLAALINDSDFYTRVCLGLVDGVSHVNKFGAAIDGVQTSATDIWDLADASATQPLWVAPTQARTHNIKSSAAADDGTPEGAGAGAQAVRIWGLTSWSSEEVSEDVVLNGTANVATVNDYVIIHRMKIIEVGSTYALNVGNISATAQTDASITAQITAGAGQTLMAIYGIPSTKTALMTQFYFNLHDNANPNTAAEIDYALFVNEKPDLDETVFLTKHTGGIISLAQSEIVHPFAPYKTIGGPAIIKLQGSGSKADLYASAGFDLILIDN